MKKSSAIDATQGSILRLVLLYSIPVILKYLIQNTFGAIDVAVLGNMADSTAVAAVGATASITSLFLALFYGLASGVKPLVARLIGAKDAEHIRKTVDTTLLSALFGGVIIALAGLLLAPVFLKLTHCPDECFEGALIYLRIFLLTVPFTTLFNCGAAILDASGDSGRPMLYILFSCSLKVILNVLLCLLLPQKVVAVAIATAIANFLSAALILRRLCLTEEVYRISPLRMRFDLPSFATILRYSLPVSFASMVLPLSNLQIQTAINSYGVSAVAGNSAAITLETVAGTLSSGFASTSAVFVAQNLGARKNDRVRRSLLHCLWMSVAGAVLLSGFLFLTRELFLPLILTDDTAAIEFAKIRMLYVMLPYFLFAVSSVISHCIPAYGYAILNTVNNLICVFAFRFFWMELIYPLSPTFSCLMLCYPVSQALLILLGSALLLWIMRRNERKTPSA